MRLLYFFFNLGIETSAPCSGCQSSIENWICLHCFQTYCGRYIGEHMLYHHLESDHPLTLSFSDLSVWCYPCEAYIDNPILHKYKNLAHVDKFGEELVWSYGDNTLMLNQMPNWYLRNFLILFYVAILFLNSSTFR